jgi:hypothetical protein
MHAHGGGTGVEGRYHLVIAPQFQTQGLGNALTREIILRGAKASGKYNDLGARECDPARLKQMFGTVADNGFEYDFHA